MDNATSIYIEKGEHMIIRNCDIQDSGNGISIGAFDGATQDILITGNNIYDNGIVGNFYEHNTYTSAIDITKEYNRFGPHCAGTTRNSLIELDGTDSSQIILFRGDKGKPTDYRKGNLSFYNDTVFSTRNGNTTLV